MARALNRLTVRQIAALKAIGRHADGGGLYFRITANGARAWVFMAQHNGKRVEIGLGGASSVTLATVRQTAAAMRVAISAGVDPRSILTSDGEAPAAILFGAFAEGYISSVEEGWKNAVHRQQWRNSLRDHAASLSQIPIADITTEHVLDALQPIWTKKPETASRVRGRIERILDAAKARGLRPRDAVNPAMWKGHLSVLLPQRSKVERGHHAALPWQEAPAFMSQLRSRSAIAARCLEFVILTAARSGEALGATWDEIDFRNKTWTVPARRMKAGAEHVVPLSYPAFHLLQNLFSNVTTQQNGLIFGVGGAARSNMAMAMLLRRMNRNDITTHGFRSTFRDWAGDKTGFPRELIEQALAHTIQNKVERAYRRGIALERRRMLMEHWALFLSGAQISSIIEDADLGNDGDGEEEFVPGAFSAETH